MPTDRLRHPAVLVVLIGASYEPWLSNLSYPASCVDGAMVAVHDRLIPDSRDGDP